MVFFISEKSLYTSDTSHNSKYIEIKKKIDCICWMTIFHINNAYVLLRYKQWSTHTGTMVWNIHIKYLILARESMFPFCLFFLLNLQVWSIIQILMAMLYKLNNLFRRSKHFTINLGNPISLLWLFCLGPLVSLLSNTLKLFGFPIFRFWASPNEGYSRNMLCALN